MRCNFFCRLLDLKSSSRRISSYFHSNEGEKKKSTQQQQSTTLPGCCCCFSSAPRVDLWLMTPLLLLVYPVRLGQHPHRHCGQIWLAPGILSLSADWLKLLPLTFYAWKHGITCCPECSTHHYILPTHRPSLKTFTTKIRSSSLCLTLARVKHTR